MRQTSRRAEPEPEEDDTQAPVQSSFIDRKLQKERQLEEELKLKRKKEEEKRKQQQQLQMARDNISLRDSIEKVIKNNERTTGAGEVLHCLLFLLIITICICWKRQLLFILCINNILISTIVLMGYKNTEI